MSNRRGTETVALTKLHGLGNDFLVWFADNDANIDPIGLARRVCDRHRGVGADGLLIATRGDDGHTPTMVLYNADGSRAEMSGNGIRCFAHGIVRGASMTLPTELSISTDGGARAVSVRPDPAGDPNTVFAAVSMGVPKPGPAIPGAVSERLGDRQLATWDLGNPHLVVLVSDPATVDLAECGPELERWFADGINVHFISIASPREITQVTWERGAGITLACGTGATAAALSAHTWGLVDDTVRVQMPGGEVEVALGGEPLLSGPSVWIADLEVSR